jgi:hypothetical protein
VDRVRWRPGAGVTGAIGPFSVATLFFEERAGILGKTAYVGER